MKQPHDFDMPFDDDSSELLLDKADALIHRHESFAVPPEVDDLPVLTDVVDEYVEPFEPPPASTDLPERLVELEIALARKIDAWFARELPQLISRELDDFAERLQQSAMLHMRASLLPELAAEIAANLDPEARDN